MNIKKKELIRFCITGCSAVIIDLAIYYLLTNFYSLSFSKIISFLSGTVFSFFLNKFWTFEKKSNSINQGIKFFTLYTMTLLGNVFVNFFIFNYIYPSKFLAFLCATGTSTILNFIGQKWWVFKK